VFRQRVAKIPHTFGKTVRNGRKCDGNIGFYSSQPKFRLRSHGRNDNIEWFCDARNQLNMGSESAASVTLAAYAIVAAGIISWQAARCRDGWQVWLLYVVERIYVAFIFHWRSNRRSSIPMDGPALIIANHRSPTDPLFVWMNHHFSDPTRGIRAISFLMAKEYYEIPGLNWVCRNLRSIPLQRGGQDMRPAKEALRRLKAGDLVGIFPEGGINPGTDLMESNPGVAWLAIKAQVPVYPVFVHNAPRGNSMIEPFCSPSRVKVSYGDPIDLSAYHGRRTSHETLREVAALLMSRLAEVGGVSYHGSESRHEPKSSDLQQTLSMKQAAG